MAKVLTSGVNIIIHNKVGAKNTPIYPFTKTANVCNAEGKTVDEIVADLLPKADAQGRLVPETTGETMSNLRFLRNDNTWATIQNASTTVKGVVQLSSATDSADETLAATPKAVKAVMDAVTALETTVGDDYVKADKIGVNNGVASLDATGKVPSTQLPSYVDDVVEVKVAADLASATAAEGGAAITPESGKIYVDVDTNKTYRWSGTKYVVISDTLALGETATTAYAGDKGKIAYEHSQATHARVDATKVEASTENGKIKINGTETTVYTHPSVEGASATNPHGTTKADVGLGKVENKTGAEIRAELTKTEVTTALTYEPADKTLATASANGLMSKEYAAKLDGCMPISVSATAPTTDGLWFEIVSEDA